MLENPALRQELVVVKRRHPSPRLGLRDKMFWVALRRLWSDWKKCFYLVAPETLPRWHSAGFRLYWTILCKARKRVRGGKRISKEIRQLILQMVAENPTGARRALTANHACWVSVFLKEPSPFGCDEHPEILNPPSVGCIPS